MEHVTEWVKILAPIGSVIVFVVAVWQYSRAERWKRIEFVGEAMRKMKLDQAVVNVTTMLDWANRDVRLFPERDDVTTQWVMVSHANLARALRPADAAGFTPVEARVREHFDAFFDYLERFHQFVKAGLIPATVFRPLLQYWCDLIAQPPEALRANGQSAVWTYLRTYGFVDARAFLNALGCKVP
jgi:hypothetical protein